MTEKLFTGTLNHNQNKTKINTFAVLNSGLNITYDFSFGAVVTLLDQFVAYNEALLCLTLSKLTNSLFSIITGS